MKKTWLLLTPVLLPFCVGAQVSPSTNLVFNPSFEEYVQCPRRIDAYGVLTIVDAWFQPSRGSADYYNVCGTRECGIPKNKLGEQLPHSGSAYCGIYCSKTHYREYLSTELIHPLLKGHRYKLRYYVSLSEYSAGAIATMGALFTTDMLRDTTWGVLMQKEQKQLAPRVIQTIATYYEPQVVNDADNLLANTKQWMPIEGTFVADGGERFLTIGNFLPMELSNHTDLDSLTNLLPGSYYYIDDVELVCLDCTDEDFMDDELVDEEDYIEYKVGSTFVLHNIFFDFDRTTLLQQSYMELRNLITILNTYPKMRIEVGGHTDGKGTVEYNKKLSENRARAVVEYLISKGIEPRRLQYKGYGKSQPIAPNDTDEGRSQNRRVEIKILYM